MYKNVTRHIGLHQQQFFASMAAVANPYKDNLDDLTDSDDLGELSPSPKLPSLVTSTRIQHQSWVKPQGNRLEAWKDQDEVNNKISDCYLTLANQCMKG
jgi:hypothetical protein